MTRKLFPARYFIVGRRGLSSLEDDEPTVEWAEDVALRWARCGFVCTVFHFSDRSTPLFLVDSSDVAPSQGEAAQ